MNNYMIITLENNLKYAVIDVLNYNNKKYFLVSKVIGDTIEEVYTICEYNELKNCFEEIEEQEVLEDIFNKRLDSKKRVLSYFDELKKDMIKLQVIDINSNEYLLKDNQGNLKRKSLFFNENPPKITDYIYLSKAIINEINIFSYGEIYNSNSTKIDEIIIIETKDGSYVLQRYYG